MKPIYDSRDIDCKKPFGALATDHPVSFTVYLPKTLPAENVFLRMFTMDQWDSYEDIPMHFADSDLLCNSYRCSFVSASPALFAYYFLVTLGEDTTTIKKGLGNYGIFGDGELWQLTVYDARMQTPPCLREGVIYQIFPDRFYRSNTEKHNVPKDRLLHSGWGGIPQWRPNKNGEVTNSDYFGGDLNGICQKLDYLESLGVSVIYLNPIFEAHSNHRYNTADYRSIDPLLGTNEDFRILCRRAKERGIAIILDGVYSHTGSDSIYFNKNKRYGSGGAYNDPKSAYIKWYRFHKYPNEYESWWGFHTLPNVEESEPSFIDFICGEDGVLRQWMRLGASGFRLDVVDELPDIFLDSLNSAIKAENSNAAIIGEVWEDASNKVSYGMRRRYFLGGQLDSVMNYPFKDALLSYIRHGGGAAFYSIIMQILENYPPPIIPALMNSISTHDTPRAITLLGGEYLGGNSKEWQEENHKLSPENYERGRQLFILASILQFGLPGMPCIYYGDEAGLCGYKDPFNRECFPWGSEDQKIQDAISALGQIRKKYQIFAAADFIPLVFDDMVCSFIRSANGINILFAVNRSEKPRELLLKSGIKPDILYLSGELDIGILGPYSGVVMQWLS